MMSDSAASRVFRAENTAAYPVPEASTALKLFYQAGAASIMPMGKFGYTLRTRCCIFLRLKSSADMHAYTVLNDG
ncbi:hypothetical protein L1285_18935 [Pseudoalteromonas sp. DL2-H2.2]|uniref:hypothetical protein n=1 Tax=Pseudoalteromonas sp. DL2-H2.2 TaxID=2908889 RepID=UPI001F310239|nr:hypothetical protein [Pseudoalteromonas sp. DL2-H2.2]MCF2910391.1 hypothetical protein [Pseudoalteromonas sp. DL2-H2.2]